MMTSIFYTGIMILLWVINLFNGTGLGEVYRTTEYAKALVILGAVIIIIIIKYSRNHQILIMKRDFICFGLFGLTLLGSTYIHGYGFQGFDYVWVYLLVFILAQLEIDEKTAVLTGLIYGILGAVILYLYNYSTIFSGWNDNTIAMIGMHSYLAFTIPFFKDRDLKSKMILIIGTAIYVSMLMPTDSRSGILFAIIGALLALSIIPRKIVDGENGRRILFLLIPLIVAILIASISQTEIVQKLNIWSYQQFQKPIFNGRDTIWRDGFQRLWSYPLFGSGHLMAGYWHNCAVACLTSCGCVGFVLWINSLYNIIEKASAWLSDYIVEGCMTAFLILYVQQSVELGLFAPNPNLIPYIMLGIMLGRVRYLENAYLESEEPYCAQD